MPHPTGPTSEKTRKLIAELRKSKEKNNMIVAKYLNRPTRSKKAINLVKISKQKNDTMIFPGKVLGVGEIEKPVNVYAFSFSKSAKEKIQKAKGKALSLDALIKDKPKAKVLLR